MGNDRRLKKAPILVLLVLISSIPSTASAWWPGHHAWEDYDAWAGYTVPIQAVYQFPAALVNQPTAPGYAVPIQAVYQFPAALVNQPGVVVPLAPPFSLHIQVGAHHVINR